MRLAYIRALASALRYADAITQLERVTQAQPDLAPPYLSLGALHLERATLHGAWPRFAALSLT